jgi:hypothetical protein
MLSLITLASTVQEHQLKATAQGQRSLFGVVDRVSDVLGKAPKAPAQVRTLLKPLYATVGTPAELVEHAAQTNRAWSDVTLEFRSKLVDAFAACLQEQARPVSKSTARPAKKA